MCKILLKVKKECDHYFRKAFGDFGKLKCNSVGIGSQSAVFTEMFYISTTIGSRNELMRENEKDTQAADQARELFIQILRLYFCIPQAIKLTKLRCRISFC